MEQLLHIEELKKTTLAGVPVVAISADPVGQTRELLAKLQAQGRPLTHRFVSDPTLSVIAAYGLKNARSTARVRPAAILIDKEGREAWRWVEKTAEMAPDDDALRAAVEKLRPEVTPRPKP